MANIDANKLDPVTEYLKNKFPECLISDIYDSDRIGQKFRITCPQTNTVYLVSFRRPFLEDNTPAEITNWLNGAGLHKLLLESSGSIIIVNSKGDMSKEKVI
jgi:hypothetical protein